THPSPSHKRVLGNVLDTIDRNWDHSTRRHKNYICMRLACTCHGILVDIDVDTDYHIEMNRDMLRNCHSFVRIHRNTSNHKCVRTSVPSALSSIHAETFVLDFGGRCAGWW